MAKNNFDSEIKDIMSNWKEDYNSDHWDNLNAKLDNEFGPDDTSDFDHEFDQSIIEKIKGQQVPFESKNWEILEKKLDQERFVKKRVINVAILQFIIVFLLLLTLWNWKGAAIVQDHQERKAQETAMLFAFDQKQESFYNQFATDLSEHRIQSEANFENQYWISQLDEIDFYPGITRPNAESLKKLVINNSLLIKEEDQNSIITNEDLDLAKEDTEKLLAFDPIETLSTSPIHNTEVQKLSENVLINFTQKKKKFDFALGGSFSPDLYVIRSPDDPIYENSGHYSETYGLSGGLIFTARKKALEIETGLLYSSVRYQPREIKEIYESAGRAYETSLQDIFFNVISAPLHFKRHISIGKNSSFYAFGGGSFHAIINSNFDIHNAVIEPLSPTAESAFHEPDLSRKDFEPGILEGGSIFDNTYLTVDLGIGFQQMVANRLSFYVQPTLYAQYSDGIGPNEDKLHKLSVYLGAKYNLNKKRRKI